MQTLGKTLAVGRTPFTRYCSGGKFGDMSTEEWTKSFKKETVDLAAMDVDTITYQESAERMRKLLKTGLLQHTDLHTHPERFFLAHRLLAEKTPVLGPGFWIRFTVHYNLCAGTVLALGSEDQLKVLSEMQTNGLLGCFSLTEKLAGVSSGLVVNTVAEFDSESDTFVISSPEGGAQKNWISQGLVADKTVVVADLRSNGKSFGPHAFLINLRIDGKVVPGVDHGDMGKKTVGNDLDNAWIAFNGVRVPKSSLLNRYADITSDGYVQKVKGVPVFHMIGQRLFTGRVAVAQAALEFRRSLFHTTRQFADGKTCWAPKGTRPLSSIPQLKKLFEENSENMKLLDTFVSKCESQLCSSLRNNEMPSLSLVEAIAVAKVKCVEDSIDFVHRLRNEIGSYALMHGTGFEQTDFLTCCKFAEGDSRILMQKMSRDLLRLYSKKPSAVVPNEAALCEKLSSLKEEDAEFSEGIYSLAGLILERTTRAVVSKL